MSRASQADHQRRPSLSNADVRQIISETTDKINIAGYPYLPTGGKLTGPGTMRSAMAGSMRNAPCWWPAPPGSACKDSDACCVAVPIPDACCVSPCDPPWRPDEQCLVWYETRLFRVPISRQDTRRCRAP